MFPPAWLPTMKLPLGLLKFTAGPVTVRMAVVLLPEPPPTRTFPLMVRDWPALKLDEELEVVVLEVVARPEKVAALALVRSSVPTFVPLPRVRLLPLPRTPPGARASVPASTAGVVPV